MKTVKVINEETYDNDSDDGSDSSCEFNFHKKQEIFLKKIIKLSAMPNIILYGSKGCGKRTLIEKVFNSVMPKKYNNILLKLDILVDNNYLELLDLFYIHERGFVIQNAPAFKIIYIHNFQLLTVAQQNKFHRTMEEEQNTKYIISTLEILTKPLMSRCLLIPLPISKDDINGFVGSKYYKNGENNLKKIIIMADACRTTTAFDNKLKTETIELITSNPSTSFVKKFIKRYFTKIPIKMLLPKLASIITQHKTTLTILKAIQDCDTNAYTTNNKLIEFEKMLLIVQTENNE